MHQLIGKNKIKYQQQFQLKWNANRRTYYPYKKPTGNHWLDRKGPSSRESQ
jgi:hypothetical protein